jgi:hypothetical protein
MRGWGGGGEKEEEEEEEKDGSNVNLRHQPQAMPIAVHPSQQTLRFQPSETRLSCDLVSLSSLANWGGGQLTLRYIQCTPRRRHQG